jgi:hypothetical protein
VSDDAQQVQRLGVLGIGLQDVAVVLFRLGQFAGLVVLDGQFQQFRDRGHSDFRCGVRRDPQKAWFKVARFWVPHFCGASFQLARTIRASWKLAPQKTATQL